MTARPSIRSQDGMTIVEVLIAIVILVVGILAFFLTIDSSTRATYNSERFQTANNIAQREMEALRRLDYDELAMTGAPAYNANPDDPRYRVNGTKFALTSDGTNKEDLIVNGGAVPTGYDGEGDTIADGVVSPDPETFNTGRVDGRIFRFVTWEEDEECMTICAAAGHKRVTVAVKLDPVAITTAGKRYVEVQSDFTDPNLAADDSSTAPNTGDDEATTQPFYLYDTKCGSGTTTAFVEPLTAHATRDTRGACGATSTSPGPPDYMGINLPTFAAADPPALVDYSNEIVPAQTADKPGLILQKPASSGCSSAPTPGSGATNKSVVHRWATRKFATDYDLQGKAGLDVFAKTIASTSYRGAICVFMYKVDNATWTPIPNASTGQNSTYFSANPWQFNGFGRHQFSWSLTPTTIPAGQRLGLLVTIHSDTVGSGLIFAYGHATYPSRFDVTTTTPAS
ncbi:MAG: type IV pilus modification PilV family protein [Solirubrobacterales bacterium]